MKTVTHGTTNARFPAVTWPIVLHTGQSFSNLWKLFLKERTLLFLCGSSTQHLGVGYWIVLVGGRFKTYESQKRNRDVWRWRVSFVWNGPVSSVSCSSCRNSSGSHGDLFGYKMMEEKQTKERWPHHWIKILLLLGFITFHLLPSSIQHWATF